jgi:hypothetical protein
MHLLISLQLSFSRTRPSTAASRQLNGDKERSVGVFFNILALHPHVRQFCTKVRCPVVGKDVPRLVMMLQGAITPAKVALFNAAIVWFQPNFRIKPKKSDVPEGFDFSVDLETADDPHPPYYQPQHVAHLQQQMPPPHHQHQPPYYLP